ncbi:hypothetical protein LQZ21_14065 [Treponema sp. TIM-1]|uniref:hypothetical protein n=1 Tax=Treponema sp. TIM-1 TaxID=2898417 RepID=UPI00397F2C12
MALSRIISEFPEEIRRNRVTIIYSKPALKDASPESEPNDSPNEDSATPEYEGEYDSEYDPSYQSSPYAQFKAAMAHDCRLFRVKDRLNLRQPIISNIYKVTLNGITEYPTFSNDAADILEQMGIDKPSTHRQYTERLAREITIEGELNEDTKYLIATPNEEVLDLKAFSLLLKDKKDPKTYADEWRKPISEYLDKRITLKTGVNFNPDLSPDTGYKLIEELAKTMIQWGGNFEFLQNCVGWLINFMGRILLGEGGNVFKEFVILLGEKDSGKTTFISLLQGILGSYSGIIQDKILQGTDEEAVSRNLYTFRNKRLLIHSEGNNTKSINTVTLKRITGDSAIALGNQDYSFKMEGKIIEDTNYAPRPDNLNDEAFNERLIIIPFIRRFDLPKPKIDSLIKRLNDNKEAIFVTMVYAAAEMIDIQDDTQKIGPMISAYVKSWINLIRDPVKAFYMHVCDANLPEKMGSTGLKLFMTYQEWNRTCIAPQIVLMRYLASESIKCPSEKAFHSRMKELHSNYIPHSNQGILYRGIRAREDMIHCLDLQKFLRNDTELEMKRSIAKAAENTRKRMEALKTSDSLKNDLDNSTMLDNGFGFQFAPFPPPGAIPGGMGPQNGNGGYFGPPRNKQNKGKWGKPPFPPDDSNMW